MKTCHRLRQGSLAHNGRRLWAGGELVFRPSERQPIRITNVEIKNKKMNKEFSARTIDDSSTNADGNSVSQANANTNVVRSCFLLNFALLILKFFYLQYLRSQAPTWCESFGQAAHFYSSPDEQINTAKQYSSEVPQEPFSGGSCTPDSVERHAFLFPKILLSNHKTLCRRMTQLSPELKLN